ncbi:MAG TPA: prolyl oligopeptidase family serine peptidase, partial [Albitalea sp.]|nr:prolyl oligopeptidase family serine peptidase [Albitalea sp.]
MTRLAASLVLIAASTFASAATADALPPPAPSHPASDVLHGVSVADPYRNLENVKSAETQNWLKAQGDYAAEQLSHIAGRDELAARVEALAKASGDLVRNVLRMPGNRIYYLKRKAGESQLKLVMRVGLAAPERVLVDPEQLAKASGVPHAINYFVPSWDGKTLAYGISSGGSEDALLHLMDLASGTDIGEPIPRVREALVHWAPDSRSLTYNQVRALPAGAPDTETFLDTTVFLLTLGQPASAARPLFGPLVNKELKLERLDVAEVMFAPDSRYMVARTTDTTLPEGRLYVAPLASLNAKHIAWRQISSFADKITHVALRGDTLYLRTYAGAPRGRVLALALKEPVLAKAVEVVPEPADGVLQSFGLGNDAIYTEVQQGFNVRVRRHAGAHPGRGVDAAPGQPGSTFLTADPAHVYRDAWVGTSTWTDPPRVLAVAAGGSARDTGLRSSTRPAGAPELEVSEVLVTSHDGAKVPLAILRKKGLPLDGNNPTLLDGYGAYGFSYEAFFDPRSIAWLERGGVLAYANVRGSGAYGDAWYRAGFKSSKPNTWKDGLACAHYLIDQHYASPATLAIWGTSAGGIFVGRSVTSEPSLFAAAIFDVGIMDAVRSEESANGITNISEFGTVKNADEFRALL